MNECFVAQAFAQVNTQTNLPEYSYGTYVGEMLILFTLSRRFSVIRRYSDFVWLSDQLAKDVPGSIVPPLPEKAVVGRFSAEFVESRRRLLEKCSSPAPFYWVAAYT